MIKIIGKSMETKKAISTTFILALLFIGIGCIGAQDDETQEMTTIRFQDITAQKAKQMIDNNEIFILDVRTKEEFDSGHIEGATIIDVKELESRVDEVPKDEKILVYCRSGRRSVTASNILVDAGHEDVYNMLGGINAWKSAGYPVVMPDENTTE